MHWFRYSVIWSDCILSNIAFSLFLMWRYAIFKLFRLLIFCFIGKISVKLRCLIFLDIWRLQGKTIQHSTSFLKWLDRMLKHISNDLHMHRTDSLHSGQIHCSCIDQHGGISWKTCVWLPVPELSTETALATFSLGIAMTCIRIRLETISVVLAMTSDTQSCFCLPASQITAMLSKPSQVPWGPQKDNSQKWVFDLVKASNHRDRLLTRLLDLRDHIQLHRPYGEPLYYEGCKTREHWKNSQTTLKSLFARKFAWTIALSKEIKSK